MRTDDVPTEIATDVLNELVSVAGSSAFNVLRADGCLIRILFNSLMAHTYCLHMAGAKLP